MHNVKEAFHTYWSPGETLGILAPNTGQCPTVPENMQDVKEVLQYCWPPAETRGILAPNAEQRPGVPVWRMHNVKEDLHQKKISAETRGTLALNTERLPAVHRGYMHGAKEAIHRYPQKTGHHDMLLLAFELYPVMMAVLSQLGEAAPRFFVFFFFVQTLLQYDERGIGEERVGQRDIVQ
jgi:hypothetical protein